MSHYESDNDIVANRCSKGERTKWRYVDPELLDTASGVAAALALSLVVEAPVTVNEVRQLTPQLAESSV